jgi:DNA-binding LacI/PurR family transcriptional regulator
MTTLRDIARKAAVSTATVSNVLNNSLYVSPALRARVLAAVGELNYRPNSLARSLRVRRSQAIGMVVPDITNPFFPAVVRGAEDVLTPAGFTLIIGNSDNDMIKEENYYRTFLERQIDGLLTVPTSDRVPDTLKQLSARGVPIVYVDRFHPGIPADLVMAENREASRRCVRHLAARGRTRIAIITGPLNLSNARERLQGYRRALKEERRRVIGAFIREGAFDRVSGREQTRALLALRPRPDALFCSNALMACGALEAIEEAGLSCPGEIALACFDQLEFFDLLRPRPTCIAAPSYELGTRGAEMILKRLSGVTAGPWERCLLSGELIQGESS